MTEHALTIPLRFNGPPGSANGGYVAGALVEAAGLTSTTTVSLRVPPPLDRPLSVEASGDEVVLRDVSTVVAVARPGEFERLAPAFVDVATARAAEARYRGRDRHPFPHCFVCGPDREHGDGLRLASGPVSDHADDITTTACTWTPTYADCDDDGYAHDPIVWAALDCPGGWSSDIDARPMVLGTVTGEHVGRVRCGETYVISAQADRVEGRKTFTSAALYTRDGELVGRTEHVWIEIDPAAFGGLVEGTSDV